MHMAAVAEACRDQTPQVLHRLVEVLARGGAWLLAPRPRTFTKALVELGPSFVRPGGAGKTFTCARKVGQMLSSRVDLLPLGASKSSVGSLPAASSELSQCHGPPSCHTQRSYHYNYLVPRQISGP